MLFSQNKQTSEQNRPQFVHLEEEVKLDFGVNIFRSKFVKPKVTGWQKSSSVKNIAKIPEY